MAKLKSPCRRNSFLPMVTLTICIMSTIPTVGQTVNVWKNVTPPGIDCASSFNNDNYGVMDILVDPVRPADCYAFTCHQGVWKSTDYGATWTGPINTGTGGSRLKNGKQWSAAIDNDSKRDPSTPPTLWTCNGNDACGVLKSTDGGISWTPYATHNQAGPYGEDSYALDLDPYDNRHLIVGFHDLGLSESFDGGVTWHDINPPPGKGSSIYLFFIDTGDSTTTRRTWLAEPQDGSSTGSFVTTNAGLSWAQIGTWRHPHGYAQLFNAGNGVAFVGGSNGVFKTTDKGQTWICVNPGNGAVVVGTPTTLYTSFSFPAGPGVSIDPSLAQAPQNPGTSWTPFPKPAGMTNGIKRASVTFDGSHYVVIAGCWNAGIWRFVESSATRVKEIPGVALHSSDAIRIINKGGPLPAFSVNLQKQGDIIIRLFDTKGRAVGGMRQTDFPAGLSIIGASQYAPGLHISNPCIMDISAGDQKCRFLVYPVANYYSGK